MTDNEIIEEAIRLVREGVSVSWHGHPLVDGLCIGLSI